MLGWSFMGRTHCTEDSTGKFSCITGDCGSGKLECLGNGAAPPATLAEFKLDGYGGLDFFGVSVFDGLNLPLLVVPSDQNCRSAGCLRDLNGACPSQLKFNSSNREIVACKDECQAFGSPQYCASADYQIIFCAAKNTSPRRLLAYNSIKSNIKNSYPATVYKKETAKVNKAETATVTVNATAPSRTKPEDKTPSPSPSTNTTPVDTRNNSQPTSGEITPSPSPEDRKPRQRLAPNISRIIASAMFTISVVVIIVRARRWMKAKKSKKDVEDDQINQVPGMPVRFSYEDLRIATDDFRETLGRGGFGSVFKGVLADGTGIAVKRLDRLGQGKRAFLAEVETIGSLHHFNLKETVYIVDHLDEDMQSDTEEIIRMIKIAAWCLQDDPESRPLMSTVVKVLEGVMEVDSNLVYKFLHALTSSPLANQHISSAPMPASVLSYPR
ncbi:unnamed protein product [Dovyalis caffra]|uniref:Protein kinase domain-containing protein n=1 Tax=Dovyalis caffra TaxID=77055 RepID=A0AAV1SLA2_9ROSI|nr:unnamed protein product [Dovyalis caffra]